MGKRGVGAVLVVVVLVGLGGWWFLRGEDRARAAAEPKAPPHVPVETTTTKVQDVPVFLDGLGTVQGLSTVAVRSQVNGVLVATPVREGQEVHKGDIIAEIDPRPFKAALDQASAKRAQDAAMLESQRLDLGRYQALAKQNYASRQQVDDEQATVNSQAALIAADDASIEAARINLDFCVIRAPIDGRVGLYQTFAGNVIEVGTQGTILSLTQDTPISVVFTLPETSLPRVEQALSRGPVKVTVSSSDDATVLATGTLLTPDNTIDTGTGTISLKAQFTNADHHLWPGQFVNTRVQVEVLAQAVTLPVVAVEHGPNGEFVYTTRPDGTVAPTTLTIGYQDDKTAVVTKGLQGGRTVVVTGQSRLAPGTHVKATDIDSHPAEQPVEASDGSASPS